MHLTKHHGLGNDFLVLVDDAGARADDRLGRDFTRTLCDRRRGVGADGFIRVGLADAGAGADVTMVLRNADGSRAEMSGNGIRCLGQAVARARGRSELELDVATDAGVRHLRIRPGPGPGQASVEVDMGPARPGPAIGEPPLGVDVTKAATFDVGNPHLVLLVDDVAAVDLATLGPACQAGFAGGINVQVVALTADRDDTLDLVTWERGVGITEACGTGACAAAQAAQHWGLVGTAVRVRMPGGAVEIGLGASVTLIGPATFVADVEVPA